MLAAVDSNPSISSTTMNSSSSSKPCLQSPHSKGPALAWLCPTSTAAVRSTILPSVSNATFLSFRHGGLWAHPDRCEKQLLRVMFTEPSSTVVWAGFRHSQLPHRWLKCHCLLIKPSFCCFVNLLSKSFETIPKFRTIACLPLWSCQLKLWKLVTTHPTRLTHSQWQALGPTRPRWRERRGIPSGGPTIFESYRAAGEYHSLWLLREVVKGGTSIGRLHGMGPEANKSCESKSSWILWR